MNLKMYELMPYPTDHSYTGPDQPTKRQKKSCVLAGRTGHKVKC